MFSRLRLVPPSLPLGAMVLLLACNDATKPTLEDLAGAPETRHSSPAVGVLHMSRRGRGATASFPSIRSSSWVPVSVSRCP